MKTVLSSSVRRRFVLFLFSALSFVFALQISALAKEETQSRETKASYIFTLNDQTKSPETIANRVTNSCDCEIEHVYSNALQGFALEIRNRDLSRVYKTIETNYQVSLNRKLQPTGKPIRETGRDPSSPSNTASASASTGTLPGLHRIGADQVHKTQRGSSVNIAVLDSGIRKTHPALRENLKGGINVVPDNSTPWTDYTGHGTHIAGIIGARKNEQGIAGVAPGTNLYSVRVLSRNKTGSKELLSGLDWVLQSEEHPKIDVANISLTGPAPKGFSPIHRAIRRGTAEGITFTVAAGNQSDSADNYIPARFDEVITVGALRHNRNSKGNEDQFASFSNFGSDLDLVAPGTNIRSTWLGQTYRSLSGTGKATPYVAGTAALLLGGNDNLTPQQVKQSLVEHGEEAPDCQNGPKSENCSWTGYPGNRNIPLVRADQLNYLEFARRIPAGNESGEDGCGLPNYAQNRDQLLDYYHDILENHDRNYHAIGTILEVLLLKKFRNEYPDHYKVTDGIAYYNHQGRTLGELDIVVYNTRTDKVELIGQAKLSGDRSSLGDAEEQLRRFQNHLRNDEVGNIRDLRNPNNQFEVEDFCCVNQNWAMAGRGALCSEFDYELDLKRHEADILQRRVGN